jgi:hypothetical protein
MNNRFLITQSLLSSWLWSYKLEDGHEDFLKTLRREPIHQNKAMLEGIRFENVLNATLNGAEIEPTHEWYKPITELVSVLNGAQQQVAVSKDITLNGINFVLYGKLDYLKAGIVYDTKFSTSYSVGKYLDSPQHPMYLALVPEAYEFQYKVCDGKYIYTEKYRPDETEPIERTIKYFMDFLDKQSLVEAYCDNWKSKY